MTNNVDHEEIIEQYVQGQLGGALLDEFRQRLSTDEEFRYKVALQKAIVQNLKRVGRNEMIAKLNGYHDEMQFHRTGQQQTKTGHPVFAGLKKVLSWKYGMPVAASVIFLIITAVLVTSLYNTPDTGGIFKEYHHPFVSLEQGSRGLPQNTASEKNKAFDAYNNGRYPESIRLFNATLEHGDDDAVLFYLGNAYLAAGKPDEAASVFRRYLEKYTEFAVESRWYLALSYIKLGKTKEAKQVLEKLRTESNEYTTKAAEILQKLKDQ